MPIWLIWSQEHRAWWGVDWHGYTADINAAGRYRYEEADEICENAQLGGKVNEVMVLAPEHTPETIR